MTPEIAHTICERIALGETLRGICASEGIPSLPTVYAWLHDEEHADFAEQYARAREAQAELYADQVIEIADATQSAQSHVQVEAARTRIDARKWHASKLHAKKFGDKTQTEITGAGGAPLSLTVTFREPGEKDGNT